MIIIELREGESIDRALKRYKKKHRNIGIMRQLRSRKHFTKKSVLRRKEILNAQYREAKFSE